MLRIEPLTLSLLNLAEAAVTRTMKTTYNFVLFYTSGSSCFNTVLFDTKRCCLP